ncbi:MAG: TetR/AcrR family transcriptional regulator [Janthinobacterium lividum]
MRADASAALKKGILDALFGLLTDKDYDRITLDEIADAARTTRQTVLRFFGNKDGVLTALLYRAEGSSRAQELLAPGCDLAALAKSTMDDLERVGDFVVQLLRQEENIPAISQRFAEARQTHEAILREKLKPLLADMERDRSEMALLQVRAVTDTLFWRVLRRDFNISSARSEEILADLLAKILAP